MKLVRTVRNAGGALLVAGVVTLGVAGTAFAAGSGDMVIGEGKSVAEAAGNAAAQCTSKKIKNQRNYSDVQHGVWSFTVQANCV